MKTFTEFLDSIKPTTEEKMPSYKELIEFIYEMGKQGIIIIDKIIKEDALQITYTAFQIFADDDCYQWMQREFPELTKEEFQKYAKKFLYTELYQMHDRKYYECLKEDITNNSHIKESMKEYIQQCIFSLEHNQYFSCACGLLAIIEGMLAEGAQSANTKLLSLLSRVEENASQAHDIERNLAIANIKGYIETLTIKSDFQSGVEPLDLNRHWLLHGRSQKVIDEGDCLVLLTVLSIILEILSQEDSDGK